MGQKVKYDPAMLQILGSLDAENAADKDFLRMKKVASEELQTMFIEEGAKQERQKREKREREESEKKAAEEKTRKVQAEVQKKHKERKQEEQARNWGLTPKNLRNLLPGRGEIQDVFSIQFHPINKFFNVRYPSPSGLPTAFDFSLHVFCFSVCLGWAKLIL